MDWVTLIGIPGALVLGFVTGLLTFIPNVGAILAALSLCWRASAPDSTAIISSFVLYLAVNSLRNKRTDAADPAPRHQHSAGDVVRGTNLLGVLFGVWGLGAGAAVDCGYQGGAQPRLAGSDCGRPELTTAFSSEVVGTGSRKDNASNKI